MRRILLLSSIALTALLYFSCEESEEGCLDIFSNNYNFHAVSSCDSCCTYPALNLDLQLIFGDTTFRLNRDTFPLNNDDSFSISKLEFILSDFSFTNSLNNYKVLDSLEAGDTYIKNDYAFYRTSGSQKIGSFRWADTIQSVTFRLGFVQEDIDKLKPFSELDQNLKLDEVLDSMYVADSNTYLASRINLIMRDSLREIRLIDPISNNILGFDVTLPIEAGQNFDINYELDIKELLTDVNPAQTNEEITELIKINFPNSFKVE